MIKLLIALCCLCINGAAIASYDIDWHEINVDPRVKVYAGKVKGLSFVAFKGHDILDHPIADIISALSDIDKSGQWMSGLLEARIIEVIGDAERIDYNLQNSPWPIRDRDFVFRITTQVTDDQKQITFTLKSEQHTNMPARPGIVRGQLLQSYFKLNELDNGKKTRLEIMMLVDPKGALPSWLVNIVNRSWAPYTINGLRDFLQNNANQKLNK